MTERSGFPQRVLTLEALTRGDAMRAAEEWAGKVRYQVARNASDGSERDIAMAQNALATVVELPENSRVPCVAEQHWRLRVKLFASATNRSPEEAEAILREDFKRYLRLLNAVLAAWQRADLEGVRIIPFDEIMAFSYFWCNKCGNDEEAAVKYLERLHAINCTAR